RNGGNPAVVLLDLKMPKVDGLELLRRMRQDVRFRTVPVVVLTSSREESDIIQSYQLGVNAFVVKPVAFKEFVGAVKNLGLFWAVLNEPAPELVQERRPNLPFIFVSGTMGEDAAIESLRRGATDYVLKERLSRLGPAVLRALEEVAARRRRLEVAEVAERQRAVVALNNDV